MPHFSRLDVAWCRIEEDERHQDQAGHLEHPQQPAAADTIRTARNARMTRPARPPISC